jgi:hypothetical protein
MVVRNDRLHLTYLDNDAIAAATLEPAAKDYVLSLRSTSYVALSATVIHEIAAASPAKRRRLVETAPGGRESQSAGSGLFGFPRPDGVASALSVEPVPKRPCPSTVRRDT